MQDCSISSALTMEVLQSCTKPSTWQHNCSAIGISIGTWWDRFNMCDFVIWNGSLWWYLSKFTICIVQEYYFYFNNCTSNFKLSKCFILLPQGKNMISIFTEISGKFNTWNHTVELFKWITIIVDTMCMLFDIMTFFISDSEWHFHLH